MFEILSSIVMSGVLGATYYYQHGGGSNDTKKIERIAENSGLVARDGTKIIPYRRTKKKGHVEYVFKLPQGLSSQQFKDKIEHFQDGLNVKRSFLDLSLSDFKTVRLNQDIRKQVIQLIERKKKLRKEIEISFDGMLVFRVFSETLTDHFPFDESLIKQGWKVPVGLNREGKVLYHDFELYPHLALGGSTRYGKSNFLNMLIVSLLQSQPENLNLTLIDLKGGIEFGDYENVKQVKNIAFEPEEALDSLKNVLEDMKKVQQQLRKMSKRKVQDSSITQRHFVIVDECGELNPAEAVSTEERKLKEECQTIMSQIARLGAGLGFRLIVATQYGTGDVIPRQVKQNCDCKLSFKVRNGTASRVVLDEEGAEKLPFIKGRALYVTDRKHIVQTPFIEGDSIKKTIEPLVVFKPRKEHLNEPRLEKGTTSGTDTFDFEETWVHE